MSKIGHIFLVFRINDCLPAKTKGQVVPWWMGALVVWPHSHYQLATWSAPSQGNDNVALYFASTLEL